MMKCDSAGEFLVGGKRLGVCSYSGVNLFSNVMEQLCAILTPLSSQQNTKQLHCTFKPTFFENKMLLFSDHDEEDDESAIVRITLSSS
jgi:hypothetical protein